LVDESTNECWVASFTDAWIETSELKNAFVALESHLLQMRGLKLRRNDAL